MSNLLSARNSPGDVRRKWDTDSVAEGPGFRMNEAARGPPPMERRSHLERYVDMLHVMAAGPLRRTHIMYKANLAWDKLVEDLNHLLKAGLISELELKEGRFYQITDLGFQVLSHSRELVGLLQLAEE